MSPIIWFAGDVHGQVLKHVLRALEKTPMFERPVAIIYLGDLDPASSLKDDFKVLQDVGVEPWLVHGNHEIDGGPEMWRRVLQVSDRNLHGRVVHIAGLRVAGLGSVFRGQVWYPSNDGGHVEPQFESYEEYEKHVRQKQGLERRLAKLKGRVPPDSVQRLLDPLQVRDLLKHSTTIFPNIVKELSRQEADVLVCHEAPSCHQHGFQVIDALARSLKIRALYHGHHHRDVTYPDTKAKLGFDAYQVGYRGITDLSGSVIVRGGYE